MSVYNAGYRAGSATIQAKWDAEVSAMAQAQAREIMAAREREQALQMAANQARKDRDAQVAAARRTAADLRERLRVATEARASDGTSDSDTGGAAFAPGSLGAILSESAPDAVRRLIDEAERADVIRMELIQMYRLHEDARAALMD